MTSLIGSPFVAAFAYRKSRCLQVDMTDEEAWAIAECFKRAGLSHYRQLTVDDEEAHCMQTAAEQLRAALADVGFAPR